VPRIEREISATGNDFDKTRTATNGYGSNRENTNKNANTLPTNDSVAETMGRWTKKRDQVVKMILA